MDIDSPRERFTRVLRDSGVHLIVTNSQDRTLTQSINGGVVGLITTDEFDVSTRASENLDIAIASSDVSGIVYTSGTTGEPKGAIQSMDTGSMFHGVTPIWFMFVRKIG